MQRLLAAVSMMLALLLAGGDASGAGEPIRIGVSLSLTGRYAEEASMQRRGYELWQRDVNDRGGILGRPVRVVIRDDRSDPASARAIYEDLIDREGVDLVFGPYSGTVTQAVAPLADARGYPMLVPGASTDTLWEHGYRHVFGLFTPGSRYALGFLEILTEHDIPELAILTLHEPSPLAVAEGSAKWAERMGLRVVHRETLPKGSTDLLGPL
ncbi:MAG: ABC transporter substrate-binding protein, partial [Deltaproteobacteria bacterium]|nr:ABC transporter substrate-binding protein [Deltaproteobacteria bacterium]